MQLSAARFLEYPQQTKASLFLVKNGGKRHIRLSIDGKISVARVFSLAMAN
jgi:hypothetical protein